MLAAFGQERCERDDESVRPAAVSQFCKIAAKHIGALCHDVLVVDMEIDIEGAKLIRRVVSPAMGDAVVIDEVKEATMEDVGWRALLRSSSSRLPLQLARRQWRSDERPG